MPHIVVKMYPGRTDDQKKQFTERIVECAMEELQCKRSSLPCPNVYSIRKNRPEQ